MNNHWKNVIAAAVLLVSIGGTAFVPGVHADGAASSAAATTTAAAAKTYTLSQNITAEVKSVLNERRGHQTRIGAVVRLHNTGTRVTRIPENDLRVTTNDGVQYTLQPSAVNARSLQPKESVELSYMLTVDRTDVFSLHTLSWIHVNEYVYPKQETEVLSVDVSGLEWHGNDSIAEELSVVKKWGESFQLTAYHSPLVYTPSAITKEVHAEGPVTIITVKVTNPDSLSQTVPNFTLTGKSKERLFAGTRIEQDSVVLQANEQKLIHFAIPGDQSEPFTGLIVTTPESYVQASPGGQAQVVEYSVGRILLLLPDRSALAIHRLPTYEYGEPIAFDPLNQLIDDHVQVALMELHMHGTEYNGYQTVVAKFKLTNQSDLPVPLPSFQAQLSSLDGYAYNGVRQNLNLISMMPNLSYVVTYSFNLPTSEEGDSLALRILDDQTTAPYSATIAAYQVAVQPIADRSSTFSFYPFDVQINYWSLSAYTNAGLGGITYSYKLKLDLDILRKDNVVVDQNFSKFKIELVDNLGRSIGSKTVPFVGMNRLVSGSQIVKIDNVETEQFIYPLTVRIYESIDTPTGTADRLVQTYKQ